MGQNGAERERDAETESAFLGAATRDSNSRRQSFGQVWLMAWIAGAFIGSILIGQELAMGQWPWESLEAAQKWTGAPVCIAVMLRLELDLGGRPLRLLLKLFSPVLLGVVVGWAGHSQHVANWLSRFAG